MSAHETTQLLEQLLKLDKRCIATSRKDLLLKWAKAMDTLVWIDLAATTHMLGCKQFARNDKGSHQNASILSIAELPPDRSEVCDCYTLRYFCGQYFT